MDSFNKRKRDLFDTEFNLSDSEGTSSPVIPSAKAMKVDSDSDCCIVLDSDSDDMPPPSSMKKIVLPTSSVMQHNIQQDHSNSSSYEEDDDEEDIPDIMNESYLVSKQASTDTWTEMYNSLLQLSTSDLQQNEMLQRAMELANVARTQVIALESRVLVLKQNHREEEQKAATSQQTLERFKKHAMERVKQIEADAAKDTNEATKIVLLEREKNKQLEKEKNVLQKQLVQVETEISLLKEETPVATMQADASSEHAEEVEQLLRLLHQSQESQKKLVENARLFEEREQSLLLQLTLREKAATKHDLEEKLGEKEDILSKNAQIYSLQEELGKYKQMSKEHRSLLVQNKELESDLQTLREELEKYRIANGKSKIYLNELLEYKHALKECIQQEDMTVDNLENVEDVIAWIQQKLSELHSSSLMRDEILHLYNLKKEETETSSTSMHDKETHNTTIVDNQKLELKHEQQEHEKNKQILKRVQVQLDSAQRIVDSYNTEEAEHGVEGCVECSKLRENIQVLQKEMLISKPCDQCSKQKGVISEQQEECHKMMGKCEEQDKIKSFDSVDKNCKIVHFKLNPLQTAYKEQIVQKDQKIHQLKAKLLKYGEVDDTRVMNPNNTVVPNTSWMLQDDANNNNNNINDKLYQEYADTYRNATVDSLKEEHAKVQMLLDNKTTETRILQANVTKLEEQEKYHERVLQKLRETFNTMFTAYRNNVTRFCGFKISMDKDICIAKYTFQPEFTLHVYPDLRITIDQEELQESTQFPPKLIDVYTRTQNLPLFLAHIIIYLHK